MKRVRALTVALLLAAAPSEPIAAVTAFAQWVGGGGVWSNPLQWIIACPTEVPPPTTPGNTASCLFTVNIAGLASDVQGNLPASISVLNVTADATLAVNLSLTSLVSTTVNSGSELSVGPAATFVTGVYQNDGLLELDPLASLTAVSLVNTDEVESTTGTFGLGSLVNGVGARFGIGPGLTTLSTTLVDNDGVFDLTLSGASLTGSLTALEFDGSGEAILGDAGATLTAVGNLGNLGSHTIRGYGSLVSATTVNQGNILANVSGRTLSLVTGAFDNDGDLKAPGGTLDIDAVGMTHDGTLEATGATGKWEIDASTIDNDALMAARQGARGEIKNADVDNAGGIIEAQSGSTIAVEAADIVGGQLTGAGLLTWASAGNALRAPAGGPPTQSDLEQRVLPGGQLSVGNLENNACVTVEGGALLLSADGQPLWSGSGEFVLESATSTLGTPAVTQFSQASTHTIRGQGLVQGFGLHNEGTIRADQAGQTLEVEMNNGTPVDDLFNLGLLSAVNGATLRIDGTDIDNDLGVIEAQAGSTVAIIDAAIHGGQLTGAGLLTWEGATNALQKPVSGPMTQSDVHQRVLPGGQLSVGDLQNNASVTVEGGALLLSAGGQPLWSGIGEFVLESATSTLGAPAVTQFSQASTHAIRGQGLVQGFGLHNEGTIRADQAGQTLAIEMDNGTPVDDLFNLGLLSAVNGATLRIDGTDIDNDLGVIEAQAGSTVAIVGAAIHGGQLTGAGVLTWEGAPNALQMPATGPTTQSAVNQRVLPGGQLSIEDLVNNASVTVEGGALLLSAGGQPLWSGSGEFVLESASSTLGASLVTQFTNGPAHTIRGQGLVQGYGAHNQGTIGADQPGQTLEIEMSNGGIAADIYNEGMLLATNAATLRIDQTDIDNSLGEIRADAGSVVELDSAILRGGTVTGGGEFEWTTSGTLGDVDGGTTYTDVLHRITNDYLGMAQIVRMEGTVINDGRIVVEADGLFAPNSSFDSHFLNGSGSLEMHGATSEVGGIIAGVWSQGPGHRLEGFGIVKAAVFGNSGVVAPGLREAGQEIGTLDLVISNTVFDASSVLEIELAGTTQGSGYDFISASASAVTLGGALDVRFRDGFETLVTPTDVFTILTGNSLTGAFANAASGTRMTTSDGYGSFLVTYSAGSVVLSAFDSSPDFGDAPDSYATLEASNGARHDGGGALRLGEAWDAELDGQPSGDAGADGGDEDGVVFTSGIELDADSVGAIQIAITTSASGRLDAWIDFNADGDWNDPGEKIFSNRMLAAGLNTESFSVMNAQVVPGETFARFRLSSSGGLNPTGLAADGEVEDYLVTIKPVDDLDLMNRLESATRTFWACNSILTGLPDDPFRVLTDAHVTLHAGNFVVVRNDSQVEEDGQLTVQTGSVPGCL